MRQIGELGFGGNELRKCARTLHVGGSFFVGNWAGIEVLAKPIFVRGIAPSMAGAPCALFIQNHCAKMGKLVFGGNELRKCVRTFHGRFVYCGNGEGIEALAKPIFVRGVSPFNGSGTAAPFNGRRTSRPLHPKSLRQIGEPWFFGTNSGSVCEPFMGGSFIAGTGRG